MQQYAAEGFLQGVSRWQGGSGCGGAYVSDVCKPDGTACFWQHKHGGASNQVFSAPATIPSSLHVEMVESQAPACMHAPTGSDTVEATLVEASQAEPVEESQPLLPVPEPQSSCKQLQQVWRVCRRFQKHHCPRQRPSHKVQQLLAHAAPPSSQPPATQATVSTQAQQHTEKDLLRGSQSDVVPITKTGFLSH